MAKSNIDLNNYLTATELSNIMHISVSAVNRKISKYLNELAPFIRIEGKKRFLHQDGLNTLMTVGVSNRPELPDIGEFNDLNYKYEELKRENINLKDKLAIKVKEIADKEIISELEAQNAILRLKEINKDKEYLEKELSLLKSQNAHLIDMNNYLKLSWWQKRKATEPKLISAPVEN